MNGLESPWYREGLAFACTRCGACCTGAPGYVWVSLEEIARLAEARQDSIADFARKYLRRVGDRLSLVERSNGDCVFWDSEKGCTVYETRPDQCRSWPFWTENIRTPQHWEETRKVCPGAGRGRVYDLYEIENAALRSPS